MAQFRQFYLLKTEEVIPRLCQRMPFIDYGPAHYAWLDNLRTTCPRLLLAAGTRARRFYLDLSPSARQPLAVVCGGLERSAVDYSIERANFPYFAIELVVRGKGTLLLSAQEVPLSPGTVFAYGPNVPHQIRTDPDDPLVKYFVDFTGHRAGDLLRQQDLTPGTSGRVNAAGEIHRVFDDLIRNDFGRLAARPRCVRPCWSTYCC